MVLEAVGEERSQRLKKGSCHFWIHETLSEPGKRVAHAFVRGSNDGYVFVCLLRMHLYVLKPCVIRTHVHCNNYIPAC